MQRHKHLILSLTLALCLLGSALVARPSSSLLAEASGALHGFVRLQATVSTHPQRAGWQPDGGTRSRSGYQLLATGGGSGGGGDPGSGG